MAAKVLQKASDIEGFSSPFMESSEKSASKGTSKKMVIVLSTDKGLCGALNSNLFKAAEKFLVKPENKSQLTNVLLYHVDDRNLTAEKIPAGSNYFKPILASERLCITKGGSGVSIADDTGESANVVIANIKADNGVIHVIDKVLLPGTRPACH